LFFSNIQESVKAVRLSGCKKIFKFMKGRNGKSQETPQL
jgi:hypothetical protein